MRDSFDFHDKAREQILNMEITTRQMSETLNVAAIHMTAAELFESLSSYTEIAPSTERSTTPVHICNQ